MIQKDELIASIDIGSSKIKCLIAKTRNDKIEIVGKSSVASKGIAKGLVANFHEANLAVRECLEIAEKQAGISLNKIKQHGNTKTKKHERCVSNHYRANHQLSKLKSDKKFIIQASAFAQKATDLILNIKNEYQEENAA